MKSSIIFFVLVFVINKCNAQDNSIIKLSVLYAKNNAPVKDVAILENKKQIGVTNTSGQSILHKKKDSAYLFTFLGNGFEKKDFSIFIDKDTVSPTIYLRELNDIELALFKNLDDLSNKKFADDSIFVKLQFRTMSAILIDSYNTQGLNTDKKAFEKEVLLNYNQYLYLLPEKFQVETINLE